MYVLLVPFELPCEQSNFIFIFEVLFLLPWCFSMIEKVLFHCDSNQ